jgi:hypothetical protein
MLSRRMVPETPWLAGRLLPMLLVIAAAADEEGQVGEEATDEEEEAVVEVTAAPTGPALAADEVPLFATVAVAPEGYEFVTAAEEPELQFTMAVGGVGWGWQRGCRLEVGLRLLAAGWPPRLHLILKGSLAELLFARSRLAPRHRIIFVVRRLPAPLGVHGYLYMRTQIADAAAVAAARQQPR